MHNRNPNRFIYSDIWHFHVKQSFFYSLKTPSIRPLSFFLVKWANVAPSRSASANFQFLIKGQFFLELLSSRMVTFQKLGQNLSFQKTIPSLMILLIFSQNIKLSYVVKIGLSHIFINLIVNSVMLYLNLVLKVIDSSLIKEPTVLSSSKVTEKFISLTKL